MAKRPNEDDDGGPNKRKKPDPRIVIVEDMEEIMNEINKAFNKTVSHRNLEISNFMCKIPRRLIGNNSSGTKVSNDLARFQGFCTVLHSFVCAEKEKISADQRQGLDWMGLASAMFPLEKLIELVDHFKVSLFRKQPPSKFGQPSIWADEQAGPQPILCLLPTRKRGLPLTLHHGIFARFHQLCVQPLPSSPIAAKALRVALKLCSSMGDRFENESLRSLKFDEGVGNFLLGLQAQTQLHGRGGEGEPNPFIVPDKHCIIIREDKVEMGLGGDAYMQASRSFDLACEEMKIMPDVPVFLLCVIGPTLTIAGGFKDHNDTIVEPLCPILYMLKDMDGVNGRAMQLAMHLFALRTCMTELRDFPDLPSPASGLPRVFQSFRDAQGAMRELTFRSRLSETSLLFAASDDLSRQLCIKIVYGPYGEQVHRLLSSKRMAPELFGISRIKSGPTMIIMEKLDESWQILHTFAQESSRWAANGVRPAIFRRLEIILDKLEEHGLVHGDFRTNNIMVKQNQEASAMVVDFDWAGKAGGVHYSLDRNHAVITWPDIDGSVIQISHDRVMLTKEWGLLPLPNS